MNNFGWICPRCNKVHAPFVQSCSCIDIKYTQTNKNKCFYCGVYHGNMSCPYIHVTC